MSDTRPVWLSREMRDLLYVNHFSSIALAWDAAPADATETVRLALTTPGEVYPELVLGPILADALTPEVLRALCMPDSGADPV